MSQRHTRTYFDTGVVIAAFSPRSSAPLAARALDLITDPQREIVVSGLLKLELLPSAINIGDQLQVRLLQAFFDIAAFYVPTDEDLLARAIDEAAEVNGLGALDALHIAAAKAAGADELITTERSSKPLFKVQGIQVTHFS